MQKSFELKIDMNSKDTFGQTAFCNACIVSNFKIAEIIIHKFVEYHINLSMSNNKKMFMEVESVT